MEVVNSFENIHAEAKSIIEIGRKATYQAINTNMVKTYMELGRLMVEEEQKGNSRADYGKYLIVELSKRLINDYGKGYSKQNLWSFKQFYQEFPILSALRRELTWTHYKLLMRIQNPSARSFYENESIHGGWNTRALDRQINSFYYERLLEHELKAELERERMLADIKLQSSE
jgi:DUF1016 N-terminal domain